MPEHNIARLDIKAKRELVRYLCPPDIPQSVHPGYNEPWMLVAYGYNAAIGGYLKGNMGLTFVARARELRTAGLEPVHIPTLEFYLSLNNYQKIPFGKAMRSIEYVLLKFPGAMLTDITSLRGASESTKRLLDITSPNNSEFLEIAFETRI